MSTLSLLWFEKRSTARAWYAKRSTHAPHIVSASLKIYGRNGRVQAKTSRCLRTFAHLWRGATLLRLCFEPGRKKLIHIGARAVRLKAEGYTPSSMRPVNAPYSLRFAERVQMRPLSYCCHLRRGVTTGSSFDRTDERMNGRADGLTGGRTHGLMGGWPAGRTDTRIDGRMEGRTDGRTKERKDGRADERAEWLRG